MRDSAAVLDETAGAVPGELHLAPPPARPWLDEVGAEPGRLRIGLITERPLGGEVDAECADAARDVARALETLGHVVEPAAPDALHNPDAASFGAIVSAGLAAEVARWEETLHATVTDLEPLNAGMVERGRTMTAVELIDAVEQLAAWSRAIAEAYEAFDVLLTPTLAVVPPRLGIMDPAEPSPEMFALYGAMSAFVLPFDATGQPAISLPTHMSATGLPIGVHLVADYGREDVLFRVAAQLEQALPWADRTPRIGRS